MLNFIHIFYSIRINLYHHHHNHHTNHYNIDSKSHNTHTNIIPTTTTNTTIYTTIYKKRAATSTTISDNTISDLHYQYSTDIKDNTKANVQMLTISESHITFNKINFEFPLKRLPDDYQKPTNMDQMKTCSQTPGYGLDSNSDEIINEQIFCKQLPQIILNTHNKGDIIEVAINHFNAVYTNNETLISQNTGLCPLNDEGTTSAEPPTSLAGSTKIWVGIGFAITGAFIIFVNGTGISQQQHQIHRTADLRVHPKADWRQTLNQVVNQFWCGTKLSVKGLWCAGTSAYEWLEMDVQQTPRRFCCYMFDTSACIARAAQQLCSRDDYRKIVDILEAKNEGLIAGQCSAYGYKWYDWKSWKCHFPVVPIIGTGPTFKGINALNGHQICAVINADNTPVDVVVGDDYIEFPIYDVFVAAYGLKSGLTLRELEKESDRNKTTESLP
ncbi:unnamed protein product, partial [Oppiella nova]